MVEGAALHADRLRDRADEFDAEVRDRLIAGAMLPGAWVVEAQKLRGWYRERVAELFRDVDILLAPATPCRAPLIGQKTFVLDGREMLIRPNMGLFTQPISFIGLPVCAVPVWTEGVRLPIGVQVIAAPGARISSCASRARWSARASCARRSARRFERRGRAQRIRGDLISAATLRRTNYASATILLVTRRLSGATASSRKSPQPAPRPCSTPRSRANSASLRPAARPDP